LALKQLLYILEKSPSSGSDFSNYSLVFLQLLHNLACWVLIIFTYKPCILILSEFFIHQLMHKWIVLKRILKFTLNLALKRLPVDGDCAETCRSCFLMPILMYILKLFLRQFTCASVGE
jgi:hypothetical protein